MARAQPHYPATHCPLAGYTGPTHQERLVRSISVQDLLLLLDQGNVQVVDVREPAEYAEGRVPGAVSLPLGTIPVRLEEIDRGSPVHLVCAVGGRSAQAAQYLDQRGFDTVNVEGGTVEWVAAGYPVDR